MEPKLPKTLYVTRENEGTEDEMLMISETLQEIDVEPGDGKRKLVGEYVLKRKVEVVAEITIVAEVG